MVLVIGEILFDELPTGKRPGGAPFNVAQHLARLGLEVRFVSRVGCDAAGEELIAAAQRAGLDATRIQRDESHASGRVAVAVDEDGIPSYDLIADAAYDHVALDTLDEECAMADLICFGSLLQRTERARNHIQEFLARQPYGIVHLYDMNLRDGCRDKAIILPSLERCDVLKLNDDELLEAGRFVGSARKGDELVGELMDRFGIRQVALTCGAQGSVLYAEGERHEQPAGLIKKGDIVDTVGAGDAFTAVLAMGLQKGWPPETTLRLAGQLSERICTIAGAVPADNTFYQPLLDTA